MTRKLASALILVLFASRLQAKLTIYTYESFTSKGSLGAAAKKIFEIKTGQEINYVSFPSAGEALNQLAIEAKRPRADLILGVDNSLLARAKELKAFYRWRQDEVKGISDSLLFDKDLEFLPFDYGYLAFVYDSRRTQLKGKGKMKLAEFSANPAFKNKIVIEDPRTSSLGMGFLLWTKGLFKGSEWKKFWQSLRPGLLTVSPSWSGAYGLFLKGEADFVLSYTTSPAYHIENEKQDFIRAIEFEEGHFRQVEGVAVLKNSKQIKLAQEFVSVLLSPEVQVQVPKTNWMYPVKEVELPRSYALLPKVSPVSLPDLEEIKREKKNWLREWTSIMAEAN